MSTKNTSLHEMVCPLGQYSFWFCVKKKTIKKWKISETAEEAEAIIQNGSDIFHPTM